MRAWQRVVLMSLASVAVAIPTTAASADLSPTLAAIVAPNLVAVSPTLVTAGQPDRDSLQRMKAAGYAAVISLAPGNTADSVSDEASILKAQGVEFAHIPIPWQAPAAEHLEATAAVLRRFEGKKVLVHCQLNMRASAIVFLYRAIDARENPTVAWADVKKVWTPDGKWAAFIDDRLRAGGIAFLRE